MLEFFSASTRMINSKRAMEACMQAAFAKQSDRSDFDCQLIIIHASIGHNFQQLLDTAKQLSPSAMVVGSSCCGVVGREGVSETMKDLAIMAIRGNEGEICVAHVSDINGTNSHERASAMARCLKEQNPSVNMVYFLASGIDIDNDQCIDGIESVMGEEVTIFGATSSDNMKGVISYQIANNSLYEHGAYLVGFADPSLKVITRATHGFVAVGEPMTVTRAEGHNIYELDGRPAWSYFTDVLGLKPESTCGETIPIGALAEELSSKELKEEYGSDHILRVVTSHQGDTMHYATSVEAGTKLWLTTRDENLIFSEASRMMDWFEKQANGQKPIAVFHADCLARGRHSFGKIMKDELVHIMQDPLASNGEVPPWLGMYGFGEFARLGGKNTYHNYTSALYAIYRQS